MEYSVVILLVSRFLILLFVLLVFGLILSYSRTYMRVRRLKKYSLSIKHSKKSVSLVLFEMLRGLILGITRVLNKSLIIKRYASKYEEYIKFNELDKKSPTTYITIKLLIAFTYIVGYGMLMLMNSINFNVVCFVICLVLSYSLPNIYLGFKKSREIKQVSDEFLRSIKLINMFMVNHSLIESISLLDSELHGPIKDEYLRVVNDLKFGLAIDVVFERFYDRVKIPAIKEFATSLIVIDDVDDVKRKFIAFEAVLRNKSSLLNVVENIKRPLKKLVNILVAMPLFVVAILYTGDNQYFDCLFDTRLGLVLLIIMICLYVTYFCVILSIMGGINEKRCN